MRPFAFRGAFLILAVAGPLALGGCASPHPDAAQDRLTKAMDRLNERLRSPAFSLSSAVQFEGSGTCVVRFKSDWTADGAKKKGYSSANTTTVINLAADVDHVEHLHGFDDNFGDHVEHWRDHVRITFLRPIQSKLEGVRIGEDQSVSSDYLARFVTIGAENADDAETRRLVHDLEQVISICEGGPRIIVTED